MPTHRYTKKMRLRRRRRVTSGKRISQRGGVRPGGAETTGAKGDGIPTILKVLFVALGVLLAGENPTGHLRGTGPVVSPPGTTYLRGSKATNVGGGGGGGAATEFASSPSLYDNLANMPADNSRLPGLLYQISQGIINDPAVSPEEKEKLSDILKYINSKNKPEDSKTKKLKGLKCLLVRMLEDIGSGGKEQMFIFSEDCNSNIHASHHHPEGTNLKELEKAARGSLRGKGNKSIGANGAGANGSKEI